MLQALTTFKQYNVCKTDSGKFVVTLNGTKSPFLAFITYKACLDKVVKLNSDYNDKVEPKFKKLYTSNRHGKSVVVKNHRRF